MRREERLDHNLYDGSVWTTTVSGLKTLKSVSGMDCNGEEVREGSELQVVILVLNTWSWTSDTLRKVQPIPVERYLSKLGICSHDLRQE